MEYKISGIILNYNSSDLTIKCVKNILKLNLDNINLIVVDNNSTDGSLDKIKEILGNEKNVYIVDSEENLGYANGNNLGIEYLEKNNIKTDIIAIINPDVEILDSKVFSNLANLLYSNSQIGAITTQTIFNGELVIPNCCAWKFLNKKEMFFGGTIFNKFLNKNDSYYDFNKEIDELVYVDVVQGCFFMIKYEVFKKVKFFDTNTFLYCEESILAQKLNLLGYKNAVYKSLCIYHNHKVKNKNLQNYKNKIFNTRCYIESRKYYINKYSNTSYLFKTLASIFLEINFYIKMLLYKIKKR